MEVRGQEAEVEELAHPGAGEAPAARHGGSVVDVSAVDGSLEVVGKGEQLGDLGGTADRLGRGAPLFGCTGKRHVNPNALVAEGETTGSRREPSSRPSLGALELPQLARALSESSASDK